MTQIIATGTKCKLKNKDCDRLNGFEVGETVVVLDPNRNVSASNPIRVTHLPGVNDDHNGYCTPAQLEILYPQPSDSPVATAKRRPTVGDKVKVVKIIEDACCKVKLGEIHEITEDNKSSAPYRVKAHGAWRFREGVFEVVGATPFDDEIARMKAALAELEAKAQAASAPVWEKAKRENVGKFHFLRESGRIMVLRGVDIDGQAHFVVGGKIGSHNPCPSHNDSDCRLATRAEVLASEWIPAE